ncbi:MAG TPA: class I SAM-dependent rRNA methyltransferase [Terriglobales bacterium]|nr:class I SAM-dependent rRNA methyltransferase [Terriglobales bacterium]
MRDTFLAEANSIVVVNRRGAARLRAGHPWVYRSDVQAEPEPAAGALVCVQDERGRKLGTAFYSSASQIAVRLLDDGITNQNLPKLLRRRMAAAIEYRRQRVREADSYRVIFSEGDLLPGLMVDKYNDVLVLQALTQAFHRDDVRQTVVDSLGEEFPGASVVERVDAHIQELERLPPRPSQLLVGERSSTVFTLNGVQFHFDALAGQKTGAFLDQRENYAAAARYAHGQALDCFTYQGGFALHLARRCESVTGVDASRAALEVAERNEQLNRAEQLRGEIEWIEGNAFDLLKDYATARREYDTVVLDPPAFAKSKRAVPTALSGYKELNLRALKMLRPGGILVSCSCSFHVSEAEFLEMLGAAAADAGRRLRIVEKRGAGADHPVLLNVPETAYLKCVIGEVLG